MIPSKFWTRHEVLTSWTYGVIQSKSFEPDKKYLQIEHKGRFHPKVLNQTWSTYKLNIQGSSTQKFWTKHEEQTSWTYRVFPSKFWTRHEQTSWIYRAIPSKNFESDIKYCQVEHTGWFYPNVLNQTWSTDKLNIQGDSIQMFWTRHEVLTSWTYRVNPSKSFEPDMKYWQIKHTGWFHPKVFNQTWRTDNLNIQGDSIQSCEPDMKYRQIKHTGWFHPKVLNQTWNTDKLNIQGGSIQKFWSRHEVLTSWTYRLIPSKSFEPDMKYWQVEHTVWFNLKVLNQTWRTYMVIPSKLWTRHEEQTSSIYMVIPSKCFQPDMKYLQIKQTG